MRWSIVYTIFRREVRDQLRDRRTLFMIFVLPILLYPILGMGALQFASSFAEKMRTVIVVGAENLPEAPALLNAAKDGFDRKLFDSDSEARRLQVVAKAGKGTLADPRERVRLTRARSVDAFVVIPDDFVDRVGRRETTELTVDYDSADESSRYTYQNLREVLSRWQRKLIRGRLDRDGLPASYVEPIKLDSVDVATPDEVGTSVWARLFPFLLVMMSLTGAFYPAIDLCAGEKERGTMETLLISPASRAEIVMGKFFTVLLASVMMALLNLASMGLTGYQLARKFGTVTAAGAAAAGPRKFEGMMTAPSLTSALWMVLLLIPLAVFFSALCLSLAVLAKSMKEGQYYMTPLYIICLPLNFITLMPGIELNAFYSLVPITGVSLLLRALILGDYHVARLYFIPVIVPTIIYGGLALRWAVDQFQREDVLFREAERFDLRIWARHLLRDKEPTPNGGEALFCFMIMLCLAWFLMQYVALEGTGTGPSGMAASQIAFILTPPLAMAFLLTSNPRRTLRLNWPAPKYVGLAVALVFTLNPLVTELHEKVEWLFPMSEELKKFVEEMFSKVPSLPAAIFFFAVIPAICEEFAFRGFILTGLQSGHSDRTAILMSALLFGFMHVLLSLFSQLFNATLLGVVIGLLAVRSKSILPGLVFHMLHNGMAVVTGALIKQPAFSKIVPWLYRKPDQQLYHGWIVAAGLLASAYLISTLRSRRRRPATVREEVPALA